MVETGSGERSVEMSHHGKSGRHPVPPGNLRLNATKPDRTAGPEAREGNVRQERLTEANRPIGPGGGKKRGDRQDTHPDPGRRNNERSGLRNDRNPNSETGRKHNKTANEGG
jgi:hypothetical protein